MVIRLKRRAWAVEDAGSRRIGSTARTSWRRPPEMVADYGASRPRITMDLRALDLSMSARRDRALRG